MSLKKIIGHCFSWLGNVIKEKIEKELNKTEKTLNVIEKCLEEYSIIVPKNKYENCQNNGNSNLIWKYFCSQGIIKHSIDEFSEKFKKNQLQNNEWDKDEWRKELEQLKTKEIKAILIFWNKILEKINMIKKNIDNMGILMLNIETNLSEISINKIIDIKIDNFYINLQPDFDIMGFWSVIYSGGNFEEIPYSDERKEENKKNKREKFCNSVNSPLWKLELKFKRKENFIYNEEVFSIEYSNDKVVGIKSFLNGNAFFHHSFCDCLKKDQLSQEDKIYLDGCLIYFIYLSELLGFNIIEFIEFFKNKKCHLSNYLKTKLKEFYNTGVYRFENTIKQHNGTMSMEIFESAKFPEKTDNISEKC